MVKKQNEKEEKGFKNCPPPLDDAWWQAVMEEENSKPDVLNQQNADLNHKGEGTTTTSPTEQEEDLDWNFAYNLYQQDQTIHMLVSGFNKGGLLVYNENLHGFVPISHLVDYPANISRKKHEEILSSYVDSELKLKVIECDQQRGRIVFSERAALADAGVRNKLFNQLCCGECVVGTVTNVTDFGAFVDLGGIEGLIHVSEISWGRVRHPRDVVKVGDSLQVYVINIDPDRGRVALSLKRLCPNPWETAEERYYPGQITEATITSIAPYGAFARLEEGLDGLIHITEISLNEKSKLTNLLIEGQQVQVRVLQVDAANQKLALSLQNLGYPI